VVYAKPPFGGPTTVLAYLARHTHRVAISRLIALDDGKVSFTWKDYSANGRTKVMTLAADEFIRRLLVHVLPDGFDRIRHYGFLANADRRDNLARCRRLIAPTDPAMDPTPMVDHIGDSHAQPGALPACPDCGLMRRIAVVPRSARSAQPFNCDRS
jgi:hypothetical protein